MGKSKKRKRPSAADADAAATASRLKKLRGVAKDTKPPPAFHCGKTHAYLSPSDGSLYEECLSTSYSGFHHETPDFSPALQCQFDASLKGLDALYQYDGKDACPTKTSAVKDIEFNSQLSFHTQSSNPGSEN